jgi:hypothetical protein
MIFRHQGEFAMQHTTLRVPYSLRKLSGVEIGEAEAPGAA